MITSWRDYLGMCMQCKYIGRQYARIPVKGLEAELKCTTSFTASFGDGNIPRYLIYVHTTLLGHSRWFCDRIVYLGSYILHEVHTAFVLDQLW